MSRTMPYECEHGVTLDWGDFGPCQDCARHPAGECPNLAHCAKCDEARLEQLAMLGEVVWLMQNSDGVIGLRLDGGVTSWEDVRQLYLPSWTLGEAT